MKLLREDIIKIIREELQKVLDEINRRGFLKGAAAMCAMGIQSACKPEYNLTDKIKKSERGIDYPDCVLHPIISPDLSDSIWADQIIDHQAGQYEGFVELTDFMSQPSLDHESINVEEDGEFLILTFANVPQDADILRFNIPERDRYLSEEEIQDIYSTPQGDVVLCVIKITFKIFEYQGNQYIHHPTYERGGLSSVPMRNTTECSKQLIQWMQNRGE